MAMDADADADATRTTPDTTGSVAQAKRKASVTARAPADPKFLSAAGGRAGFAISRCRRKLQALQPPLRRTNLPDLLKSPRRETHPEFAPARGAPSLAFHASRTVPTETLPSPSDPALDSCLLLPHRSKLAADDAASTSGDDSGPVERRCDTATSSASCLAGIRVSREKRAGKLLASRRRRRRNPKECRRPGCTPLRDNRCPASRTPRPSPLAARSPAQIRRGPTAVIAQSRTCRSVSLPKRRASGRVLLNN